jgi:hypothetical protein
LWHEGEVQSWCWLVGLLEVELCSGVQDASLEDQELSAFAYRSRLRASCSH